MVNLSSVTSFGLQLGQQHSFSRLGGQICVGLFVGDGVGPDVGAGVGSSVGDEVVAQLAVQ